MGSGQCKVWQHEPAFFVSLERIFLKAVKRHAIEQRLFFRITGFLPNPLSARIDLAAHRQGVSDYVFYFLNKLTDVGNMVQ